MNGKRTGFTLVELIVVIMIVGVLSGSVMLLAGNTDDRDEANQTIANLRQLKSAALMYYADNHMHAGHTTLPLTSPVLKTTWRKHPTPDTASTKNSFAVVAAPEPDLLSPDRESKEQIVLAFAKASAVFDRLEVKHYEKSAVRNSQ